MLRVLYSTLDCFNTQTVLHSVVLLVLNRKIFVTQTPHSDLLLVSSERISATLGVSRSATFVPLFSYDLNSGEIVAGLLFSLW